MAVRFRHVYYKLNQRSSKNNLGEKPFVKRLICNQDRIDTNLCKYNG